MFIGRQAELTKLEEFYQSNQFEFSVIYGRRRVGKTTLINEFCKHKKAIYFMAAEATSKENLNYFSKAIFDVMMPGTEMPAFESFSKLFDYVDTLAQERIILAIDEYPYLAESDSSISSLLQIHIDHKWKESKLMLILCGSSMRFMENQVLGYKSPLYGRRTAQFKILPFDFLELQEYRRNDTAEERALLYGITGGVPEYLSRVDPEKTIEDTILSLYFEPSGRMFEEPDSLMKQELRNPAVYNAVIGAIATGASRMNDIAQKVGEDTSACANQLNALIALGIVKKESPSGEPVNSRKTLYRIDDSAFIFWYRFVAPNRSNIVRGLGKAVFEKRVKPQLNDFMGEIFEKICIQYLYRPEVLNAAPFFYGNIGRWWGNNPKKKRQEEIDLLAGDDQNLLLGECKWTNEAVNIHVLEDLLEQGALFHQPNQYYYLFAKRGFTPAVKARCETLDHLFLISLKDMTI